MLVGQDAGRVEQAVADLLLEDVDATGRAVDVADVTAVQALGLGPLAAVDVLVSAAAVTSERTARTLRTSPEEWRRVLGTDLDGVFATTAAFVPGVVERRSGRVIT